MFLWQGLVLRGLSLKMEDAVLNSHQTGEGTETASITSQVTALNTELIAREEETCFLWWHYTTMIPCCT